MKVLVGEDKRTVRTCKYCFGVLEGPAARKTWVDPVTGVTHLESTLYHRECLVNQIILEGETDAQEEDSNE